MCTLSSVRLIVMVLSWFKLVFGIYVFAVGCYFTASTDLAQAFGSQFNSYGLSLIFLALLSMGIILPHKYAVNRHNRFLLAACFVFDTIVFCELINFGVIVQSYTYPEFAKVLQNDCLRNTPLFYTAEDCRPFFEADRTAGFRLVWQSYFSKKSSNSEFQVLSKLEGGLCCGFFPPFNCVENKDKFPKNLITKGISSSLLKQRVQCGEYPGYYPETDVCVNYYDFSVNPPIVGGCNYDLGVGFCLEVDISTNSMGCASAVEDFVVALIAPHAVMFIGCAMFNLMFMLIECCMWWKRKETDIFPEFVVEKKSSVQFRNVRFQYEIVPKKGLLVKEGFLPPPQQISSDFTDLEGLDEEEGGAGNNDGNNEGNGGGDKVEENGNNNKDTPQGNSSNNNDTNKDNINNKNNVNNGVVVSPTKNESKDNKAGAISSDTNKNTKDSNNKKTNNESKDNDKSKKEEKKDNNDIEKNNKIQGKS